MSCNVLDSLRHISTMAAKLYSLDVTSHPMKWVFSFLIRFCNLLISLIKKKRTHTGMAHLFQICVIYLHYIYNSKV